MVLWRRGGEMSAEVQEALPLRVSAHRCVCNEGGGPDNKLLRKCWFCSVCVCVKGEEFHLAKGQPLSLID